MPTYDYQCDGCESIFEVKHGYHDEPELECPDCGSSSFTKLLNTPTIIYTPGDHECTVGTLAERNANRMSDDAKRHLLDKQKTKKKEGKLPPGMKRVEPPKEKPWHIDDAKKIKKLSKISDPKKLERYIQTGDGI